MGTSSTPTFEVRDGEDWITWTTSTGDTTSDKVSRVKEREEWKTAGQAYEAWKADTKAQKEAKAADEAKAEATPAPAPAPEDDDDDNDKNDKSLGRRTLAKGYRK